MGTIQIFLTIVIFVSFLTFIVSAAGLIGYAVNSLFRKLGLPSRKFTYPVFKILTTMILLSTLLFFFASFSAEDLDQFTAEEELEEVVADTELSQKVKKEEQNDKKPSATSTKSKEKEIPKEKEQAKQAKEQRRSDGPLTVHFIDVGQGDAMLLKTKEKAILLDAGDWRGQEVVSYLRREGIDTLDLVVGSHEHADHIGQMTQVLNEYKVKEVWLTGNQTTSQLFENLLQTILEKDIAYHEPRAGEHYQIGDMQIEVLHPEQLTGDLNNDSLVLKLTYGTVSFLFTGDAERQAEDRMLQGAQNLEATILKIGHHGSDTSTTPSFLQAVNPEVAIISVGANNAYGHPSQSVIDLLHQQGIDLYATKSHGHIKVITDGKDYHITTDKSESLKAGKVSAEERLATSSPAPRSSRETSHSISKEVRSRDNCIDLNRATAEELERIIHIGPVRAEEIVLTRPFQSVDDLISINGIGSERLADIKAEGKACVK